MKDLTVTQKRCLELARIIREGLEGVRFDMGQFCGQCGAAACIGGHAVAVYEPQLFRSSTTERIKTLARGLLGLSSIQTEQLFFAIDLEVDTLQEITPAMAAATLERFALTGKVEWE